MEGYRAERRNHLQRAVISLVNQQMDLDALFSEVSGGETGFIAGRSVVTGITARR